MQYYPVDKRFSLFVLKTYKLATCVSPPASSYASFTDPYSVCIGWMGGGGGGGGGAHPITN